MPLAHFHRSLSYNKNYKKFDFSSFVLKLTNLYDSWHRKKWGKEIDMILLLEIFSGKSEFNLKFLKELIEIFKYQKNI